MTSRAFPNLFLLGILLSSTVKWFGVSGASAGDPFQEDPRLVRGRHVRRAFDQPSLPGEINRKARTAKMMKIMKGKMPGHMFMKLDPKSQKMMSKKDKKKTFFPNALHPNHAPSNVGSFAPSFPPTLHNHFGPVGAFVAVPFNTKDDVTKATVRKAAIDTILSDQDRSIVWIKAVMNEYQEEGGCECIHYGFLDNDSCKCFKIEFTGVVNKPESTTLALMDAIAIGAFDRRMSIIPEAKVQQTPFTGPRPMVNTPTFSPSDGPIDDLTTSPTAERPTTERPMTERPMTQRPTTQRPTTQRPTESPTRSRSNFPSISYLPSFAPSLDPSQKPSLSLKPSSFPSTSRVPSFTQSPTALQSEDPSSYPTYTPTSSPTDSRTEFVLIGRVGGDINITAMEEYLARGILGDLQSSSSRNKSFRGSTRVANEAGGNYQVKVEGQIKECESELKNDEVALRLGTCVNFNCEIKSVPGSGINTGAAASKIETSVEERTFNTRVDDEVGFEAVFVLPPSSEPSSVPSLNPSYSSNPSRRPSEGPSAIPSPVPSGMPSELPSSSLQPSFLPSDSAMPSSIPSLSLMPNVSLLPSLSAVPSEIPSLSSEPSFTPSSVPSKVPSTQPSLNPSFVPSAVQSSSPTMGPSLIPTHIPTSIPSSRPSVSSIPSVHPSMRPSSEPSFLPSLFSSNHPSLNPSSIPSSVPSILPSTSPSSIPSSVPSFLPSVGPSFNPSSIPSKLPSLLPSIHPSFSSLPSVGPSLHPTISLLPSMHPSISPSSEPSFLPSLFPSNHPSLNPSSIPSSVPIILPSTSPSSITSSVPSFLPSIQGSQSGS